MAWSVGVHVGMARSNKLQYVECFGYNGMEKAQVPLTTQILVNVGHGKHPDIGRINTMSNKEIADFPS